MMVVFHGRRLYGRVDSAGGRFVATLFFYIQFLPIVPLSSHLVLSEKPGETEAIRIPMQWRSVIAGYLRTWGLLATVGFVVAGLVEVHDARASADAVWSGVEGVVALSALALAFGVLGRVDRDARAQRAAWERRIGHPVDPALFDEEAREKLAKKLRKQLRKSTPQNPGGYREVAPRRPSYRAVALDPNVKDRDLLETAFTLARLDESLAGPLERAEFARDRAAIWGRLRRDALAETRDFALVELGPWLALPTLLAAIYLVEYFNR
jgi:hypothetical protein